MLNQNFVGLAPPALLSIKISSECSPGNIFAGGADLLYRRNFVIFAKIKPVGNLFGALDDRELLKGSSSLIWFIYSALKCFRFTKWKMNHQKGDKSSAIDQRCALIKISSYSQLSVFHCCHCN